jgi:glyoxylase-like metal-dependent hydrolase (beta-lactamase superfamily II)
VLAIEDVARLVLGTFIRPAAESGTGAARVEVVLGYVVRHSGGLLLFDTGIGVADDETEAWYRPTRVPLAGALGSIGLALRDVDLVANCHLHFDHCGGNPELAGRPVFCQRTELATARTLGNYTVPDLVDHAGSSYHEIDGEAEILPGVILVPTPGHTAGHQSLVVRCDDGTVVLAGQSHEHASDFAADALAVHARQAGAAEPLPIAPEWVERLLDLDPRRVLFAHDLAVWEPA